LIGPARLHFRRLDLRENGVMCLAINLLWLLPSRS
jgi:hypothetical protein